MDSLFAAVVAAVGFALVFAIVGGVKNFFSGVDRRIDQKRRDDAARELDKKLKRK